jgi:hypothetical protein
VIGDSQSAKSLRESVEDGTTPTMGDFTLQYLRGYAVLKTEGEGEDVKKEDEF